MCYLVKVDSADAIDGVSEMVLDVPSDVATGKELKSAVGQDQSDAAGVIGGVRLFYFETCHRSIDIAVEALHYLFGCDAMKKDRRNFAGGVVL